MGLPMPAHLRLSPMIALVVTMTLGVAGAVGAGSTAVWAAPVTVEVLTGPAQSEYDVVAAMAERWNATHKDVRIKVEMIPEGSLAEQILLIRMAGGKAPDLFTAMAAGPMASFARDGALLALDQFSDFWNVLEKRTAQNITRTYRLRDGHYYLIPWQAEITMIEYNEDLMDRVGWPSFPKTYGKFIELSRKLQSIKVASIDVSQTVDPWDSRIGDFYCFYLAASGGKTLVRNNRAAFDNEFARNVFQFFADMVRYKFVPQDPISGDGFVQQKIFTQRYGQVAIVLYREQAKFKWNVAPILVPDDYDGPQPPYTYFNMKGLAIPKQAAHPKEAWEFVKFMLEPENEQILLASGRFPVREDLARHPAFAAWFKANPLGLPFALNMAHTRGLDIVPNTQEIFRAISAEFVAAITGKKSVEAAVKTAVERVDKLLF
ncbi:MAG: sugar ABC transporter substrate-binding protein [Limnochordales bacterium]|nr:sugar ABC transporter substrate-binding protein [Limnochordales bacterium]